MNRILLTTSVMFIAVSAMAQKDYSKKVQSQHISLPSYNISEVDPATVSIEYAMNNGVFGTEKLKSAESTCVPKGGTVKDAVKVTSHYYEIPYTKPESYIVAKSTDGTIVYANQSSDSKESILKFGWDEKMNQPLCGNFISDKLKKDYASKGESFKAKKHNNYQDRIYKKALEEAKANVYLSYFPEEFKVYSAKGKLYEYIELDAAFESAIVTYKSIKKNGLSSNDIETLKGCILVWEKELETLDLEDKKARITKSIGKGLHENCIRASLYMFDFENAKSHSKSFLSMYGNHSDNRSNAVKKVLKRISQQTIAAKRNASIINDVEKLHLMASASSKKVNAKMLPSSDFDRLSQEAFDHNMSARIDASNQDKEDKAKAIESGELNPYQQFYTTAAVGGPAILMTMPPSALSGFPELKELPSEMCEFEDLTQLVILNNSIETITPEIAKLISLKKLDLSGNKLKTLPPEIGKLINLKTLKLNKNPIESIPVEIANCTNLTSLTIKGSKLSEEAIAELQRLLPDCKIKN